jgi:hypothetical protein
LQVIHQRDQLIAVETHRVAPHVARPVRFTMSEQIDSDHAVAARRQIFGEALVHRLREQQPVHEDQCSLAGPRAARRAPARAALGQRRRPAAVFRIGDPLILKGKTRHNRTLPRCPRATALLARPGVGRSRALVCRRPFVARA